MKKRAVKNIIVIVLGIVIIAMSLVYGNNSFANKNENDSFISVNKFDVRVENVRVKNNQYPHINVIGPNITDVSGKLNFAIDFAKSGIVEFYIDVVNKGNINAKLKSYSLSSQNVNANSIETEVNNSSVIVDDLSNMVYKISYDNDKNININDNLDANTKRTLKIIVKHPNVDSKEKYNFTLDLNYDI